MAESFLLLIADNVLSKLASLGLEEFYLAWGLKTELHKINKIIVTIKAVLSDAEQRQLQNNAIEVWLRELKDLLYDIEDAVDEFHCESKALQHGSNKEKVRRFFSTSNPMVFRFRMGHLLKSIRERVAEIASLKSNFGLTERINDGPGKERVMTHSFVREVDVIGREDDKERIVELLLQCVDDENVYVIPIVGIGGLGKTTLAKVAYNDTRVASCFEKKLWVCVSEEFDLQKLIVKILKSIHAENRTSPKYADLEIDQLQNALRESLDGTKYLLVLDDVWNEDLKKWRDLKTLLLGGGNGSKILVTTRSNRVASIMGSLPAYNLNGLPHDHCLSLFFQYTFIGKIEKKNPNIERIGEEIVRKCGGVPLAVVTLGTLLGSTTEERDWESIRDSEIWRLEQSENDILPALKLSYEHLPSYLKRCFAYCSIFPKDYPFDDEELVHFWMAHGLLDQSPYGYLELEDVGFRFFKELSSRCFFQDFWEFNGRVQCKMHDLLHDLALSVTRNEFSVVLSSDQEISRSVRYVSFPYPESISRDFPKMFKKFRHVRSISFRSEEIKGSSTQFIKTCLSRCHYLRYLDLAGSEIEVLPSNIGDLKHMRFICLCHSRIKLIPNSICKLQNLQSLDLGECPKLERLPNDINRLINLRSLWITTKQTYLPKGGVGLLKSLRFLYIWKCKNLERLFEDMEGLKMLRRLVIGGCNRLTCLPKSIKRLTSLDTLSIAYCGNLDLKIDDKEHNQHITRFALRRLEIEYLPKLVEFPDWLFEGSTETLQIIKVVNCPYLEQLPSGVGDIPTLREYVIEGCPKLHESDQTEATQ